MTAGSPGREPERVVVRDSTGVQVGSDNVQNIVAVDAASVPAPQGVPAPAGMHNLPAGSAVFEGRDLRELAELLHGAREGVVVGQAAVHGLGGVGKTELALHYARAYRDRYRLVWWITADTAENVGLGLAGLTQRLHPVTMLADAREWAVGWLQSHRDWLLVLDNVEDFADIAPLLGQVAGRGHVLVTTRRDLGVARWARHGLTPLRLAVLDRAASVRLLTRLTGVVDEAGAGRLAEVLGDLPLGLEQAAAYIGQHHGLDFDGYRRLLTERFSRVAANPGEGGTAQRSIAGIWQLSMAAIGERSPLATQVMAVLAWLAPDALPEDVLTELVEDALDLGEALALLASYSMISRAGGAVSVHRLVQAVTRDGTTGLSPEAGRLAFDQAAWLLVCASPSDPVRDVAGWPRWTALLPHIDALTDHGGVDDNIDVLVLCATAGIYRQHQGQVVPAIALFERALEGFRRLLGDDHVNALATLQNLASAYQSVGRVTEAITLFEQTLAHWERVLDDDDPEILSSRNNLAQVYESVGRAAEAVSLFEQVVAGFARVLGDDHPDTLLARRNLAHAYRSLGRVDEGTALSEQVVADHRRVLGDDHPDTLLARHNLAGVYRSIGRVAEAIVLLEQVVTDSARVLGDDHPNTLTSRHGLAYAYEVAGRVDEAISLCEQVLADRRRVLGDDHPHTQASRHNLAGAYESAGRVDEAIPLYEQVVADHRRVLGDDHPQTQVSRNNLAYTYLSAGRVDESISLYEQVVAHCRRMLGDDHPNTLLFRHNLAHAHEAAGRTGEAVARYERRGRGAGR